MNSYSLQLKSLSNQATAFQELDGCDAYHACVRAKRVASTWGRDNGSDIVEYTVSRGQWSYVGSVAAFPRPKKSPLELVTIQIDSKDKFFAVLEALQQYVDNCDDAVRLTGDQDEQRELAAKSNAAGEVRDQLDAVLASLAG